MASVALRYIRLPKSIARTFRAAFHPQVSRQDTLQQGFGTGMLIRTMKGASMNNPEVLKKFMRETASFAMHFAHGGLLVAGLIVTTLLFVHVRSAESHERGLQEIGSMIAAGRAVKTAAPATEAVGATAATRATVDYLSRKYRVAASAIEPIVRAALAAGERADLDPMLIVAVMAIESGSTRSPKPDGRPGRCRSHASIRTSWMRYRATVCSIPLRTSMSVRLL
jgi:hypothetical protein